MKLRSIAILAAAIAIPAASFIALPEVAEARDRSNRAGILAQRGDRGNLTPEQREAKRAERMAKLQEALGLSDSQVEQIKAVRETYKPQMQALREEARTLRDGGASREEVREALGDRKQALREDMESEMQSILTAEQLETWEEMKEQRRGRRQGQRNEPVS